MALLILEKFNGDRVEVQLENDPISIGRGPYADVSLMEDAEVSRHQCALMLWEDDWVLKDAHSANGTWVNQKKIEICVLKNDDVIRIGKTELEFRAEERQRGKSPCAMLQVIKSPEKRTETVDKAEESDYEK